MQPEGPCVFPAQNTPVKTLDQCADAAREFASVSSHRSLAATPAAGFTLHAWAELDLHGDWICVCETADQDDQCENSCDSFFHARSFWDLLFAIFKNGTVRIVISRPLQEFLRINQDHQSRPSIKTINQDHQSRPNEVFACWFLQTALCSAGHLARSE
jgi:hypothetical protein